MLSHFRHHRTVRYECTPEKKLRFIQSYVNNVSCCANWHSVVASHTPNINIRTYLDRTATRHTCARRRMSCAIVSISLGWVWRRCIIHFNGTNDAKNERKKSQILNRSDRSGYWSFIFNASSNRSRIIRRNLWYSLHRKSLSTKCIEYSWLAPSQVRRPKKFIIIMRQKWLELKLIRLYDTFWYRWPSTTLYNK